MTKVKILSERYEYDLEKKINQYLEQGYELSGTVIPFTKYDSPRDYNGVLISTCSSQERWEYAWFMQVMIKEEEDDDEFDDDEFEEEEE